MLKKIMKIVLIIIGIVVLAGIVLAIIFWESVQVMSSSKNVHGVVGRIPHYDAAEAPALTIGEADWVCWRGINGDGRAGVSGLITDWSSGLRKVWEVEYLCHGTASATWSAPVIQGNRLIVCGRGDSTDIVFCLNPEDGSLIWEQSYPAKPGLSHGAGSRATPWIDGDRVVTFGRAGDLICWNLLDGSKVWHKNVEDEGGEEQTWGHSSSPLVTDELVIANGGGTARTIAYDKETGDVVWKTGEGPPGYAVLLNIIIEDQKAVLSFHGTGLAALDRTNGRQLWNTPWETESEVNATTPLIAGDKIFITSGYGFGCALLKVSKSGAEVVWRNKVMSSHHSDPLLIDGYIYGFSGYSMQNKGSFKCVDLNTGEEKWSTNKMGWGTCVQVNDLLLCMDIKGNLFLMQPDPEGFILVTELDHALGKVRGAAWTVPVVANNRLYLRFKQKLVCLDISSDI